MSVALPEQPVGPHVFLEAQQACILFPFNAVNGDIYPT
ncbi:MAG: hypothetical protein KatS3mg049_0751 [Caldilinea sp.]|jgi:hypothetical protein|nr:MAG: hypothetical protein KatS3mg049_0751 [Caldilinea sp.]